MSNSKSNHSVIKSVLYSVLSFFLAVSLFFLGIACIVKFSLFSQDFMMNAMASQGYSAMIQDELKSDLKNLGHASGLTDEFVDKFVDSLDISGVEYDYVKAFYSGDNTLVDTATFKQQLYAALDQYVIDTGMDPEKVSQENVDYLVEKATSIYVNDVSIPFFSTIANYVYKYDGPLTILIAGLAVFAAIIAFLIIFTNEFVHRRYRYLCYSFTTTALSLAVIPTVVFVSGYITKIGIATRSLYNLFVSYFSSFFMYFYFASAVFAVAAIICFLVFYKRYKRITGHHSHH